MRPNKEGIWEWFAKDGTKRLVFVCDTNKKLREVTGEAEPCFEVCWWGGYYSIHDQIYDLVDGQGRVIEKNHADPAEWVDRWGNFVGEEGSVPEEQIYSMPTPEELAKWKAEGKI